MRIDIAKSELQEIRSAVNDEVWRIQNLPNPGAYGNRVLILRKMNRKLNRALKKVYGHDCCGKDYFT